MSERATAAGEVRELPAWIMQARAELSSLRERVRSEPLARSTKREYERRAKRLATWEADGQRINPAGIHKKRERYLWKAAGNFARRAEVRSAMNAADKCWKASYASEGERWKAYRSALDAVRVARDRLDAWEGIDFAKGPEADGVPVLGQASHRKRPATDSQLGEFFELAKRSQYRPVFLAMEFAGIRPEEFGNGVRVEIVYEGGKFKGLMFVIESAKCREGHGQPVRSVFIAPPKSARADVKARYVELAGLAKDKEGERAGLVLKVGPSEKLTAGQKVSRAFAKFAERMTDGGPNLSPYSLRHRFSAQAKASLGTLEEVAQVLGHQSTETQKHYGRALRGGSAVSPVAVQVGSGVAYEAVRSYGRTRNGPAVRVQVSAAARSSGAPPPRPRF